MDVAFCDELELVNAGFSERPFTKTRSDRITARAISCKDGQTMTHASPPKKAYLPNPILLGTLNVVGQWVSSTDRRLDHVRGGSS